MGPALFTRENIPEVHLRHTSVDASMGPALFTRENPARGSRGDLLANRAICERWLVLGVLVSSPYELNLKIPDKYLQKRSASDGRCFRGTGPLAAVLSKTRAMRANTSAHSTAACTLTNLYDDCLALLNDILATQRNKAARAATLLGTKIDQEHLILFMMNDRVKPCD